jgi:hypothetical protein
MAKIRRLLLVAAVGVIVTAAAAVRASACGDAGGYSYAGLGDPVPAFGVSARVTDLAAYTVRQGHVAAWVGVGGPGQGPKGSDEWLQVGLSRFPDLIGTDAYYEVELPRRNPVYHRLRDDLPLGRSVRLAVLEMRGRRNWWRVWLNDRAASPPILLPSSHGRWGPMATAESWDGGSEGACNSFLWRFHGVRFAHAPGGGWSTAPRGYTIRSSKTGVRRARDDDDFVAAEGWLARRRLRLLRP